MQMYKVFVNEKRLTLGKAPAENEKTLAFEGSHTLEIAMDLLENTSCPAISVCGGDPELIWENFRSMFRIVEAAGGIVFNASGNILFIHRLGKWDLPKGKIEKGESTEDAAVREVEEETALSELQLDGFINKTYHIYTERNNQKVLKTTYWYRMKYLGTASPKPQVEEGITEVDWKNGNQIRTQVFPSTFKNILLILSEVGIK